MFCHVDPNAPDPTAIIITKSFTKVAQKMQNMFGAAQKPLNNVNYSVGSEI